MSLFKQIAIVISIFFMIVLSTVMWLNFKTANDFVQNQLYSKAQDTAYSLGLSISKVADPKDTATMEVMINAIFDSGYYKTIILYDKNGKELIKKENSGKVKGIPDFFINFIDLKTSEAKTDIMMGWAPFGVLSVESHSGYAYKQLWDTLKEISAWFVIISFFVLSGMHLLLRIVLSSLDRLKAQAEAISENNFIIQKKTPFTTDFKPLVLAMNKMVGKVKEIFERESQTLQKYNELLYSDGLTKLPNRRFFKMKLNEYCLSEDASSEGFVLLYSFEDLESIKEALGYKKVDEILLELSKILKSMITEKGKSFVARLGGSDFALVFPEGNKDEIVEKSDILMAASKEIIGRYELDMSVCFANIGITAYKHGDELKNILSRADYSLAVAKSKEPFSSNIYSEKEEKKIVLGKEEWKKEITDAIKEDRLKLAVQPIICDNEKPYQEELYLRLKDRDGRMLSAGYFMPVVSSIGLGNSIDKHVFSLVSRYIEEGIIKKPVAINLSILFISDFAVLEWLEEKLKELKKDVTIYFELSNNDTIKNIDKVLNFKKIVGKYDCGFGIDRFDVQSGNFSYLQKIKPSYIKIDKDYVKELSSGGASKSLELIAKSLDIKLIGTNIESEEDKKLLEDNYITCMQGRYIGDIKIIGE